MYHDFLILGGAGLVGLQVCRHIVFRLDPRRIVVASLFRQEAEEACRKLEAEFGDRTAFVPAWGNLFVPFEFAESSRGELLGDRKSRQKLLAALYDDFDEAYRDNHLVQLIRQHRPEVVVDCVNTATGLSYQDVFDGAAKVRHWIDEEGHMAEAGVNDVETFLLSQTVPQLIRHVRFVHKATTEYQTRVYLKVGTTGTGGMGLNIPYTHSEDKPSHKLLAKTEAAFGHTGLLFLLARTPNAPIVKEVKPAAMIGYRGVRVGKASDKHGSSRLFQPRETQLDGGRLDLHEAEAAYPHVGELEVPLVDTGENGVFTRGEFAAITALGQMEYITPEEIARVVVHEIRGANTGQDVISAVDAAVLNPSYKAGLIRSAALTDLATAEEESGIPSVALGRLGPPELSKLLFEAQLFRHVYGSLQALVDDDRSDAAVAALLAEALEPSGVARMAPSIGVPVLLPDGRTLLRGPRINVPEVRGHTTTVSLADKKAIRGWAEKGWVDLQPRNVGIWQQRFKRMLQARAALRDTGSAAANIRTYSADVFEIGEVVAWIFNNEMGGFRIKP